MEPKLRYIDREGSAVRALADFDAMRRRRAFGSPETVEQAAYGDWMQRAWNALTGEEQTLIRARYIRKGGWVYELQDTLHYERTWLYHKSAAALQKLARLLYGID